MRTATSRFTASRCERGVTLIELLVTLSVLVIVLGTAVPSMSALLANNQVATAKSAFMSSLALARSEAARTGQSVIAQATAGGPAGNEFANGWDLYLDLDGNGAVNAGDTLLRHYEALPGFVRLQGQASLVFSASGYLSTAAQSTYTVCRSDGDRAGFSIMVAPSGVTSSIAITSCGS